MLRHEEMIENVHRRIAQYEEEKKMKNSKLKKLFSAKNNKTEATNEDEYTEEVIGTDNISSSNNTLRILSSLAAAAVLVTGLSATGFLLHKNKANKSALTEKDVFYTESTESDNIVDSGAVAPFVDFKQVYFGLCSLNESYDEDSTDYSSETYDKLAVFLNNFTWGEGNDIKEMDIPDFNNFEGDGYNGKGYAISWRKGDVWFYVYVTENGKSYYLAQKCQPDGNCFNYPIIESSVYNIDYEALDNGIQDILSSDVPDTSEYLSKRDKMYLTQGEFQNGIVERCKRYDSEALISEGENSYNALQCFLRDDFVGMLQKDKSIEYNSNDLLFTVACYYKTSSTTTRRLTYYISSNGAANLCEYELTEYDDIPTGCSDYYIDIKEFETVLKDIASGKYDDKYSIEAKTTTTAVTTSTTTTAETTTVTTTEQTAPSEEEPEDEPVKTEQTDEELVREFYMSEHNGWDGSYEGSYEAMDENGNMVDYKNEINWMLHKAEIVPFERVLGPIADEEDAIEKGKEILLNLRGQEYIDNQNKEYIVKPNGITVYRDNPIYVANYHEDYDIWVFYPTLFSGSSEDGKYHIATPGTVPFFYIRGCDGKLLAYWG